MECDQEVLGAFDMRPVRAGTLLIGCITTARSKSGRGVESEVDADLEQVDVGGDAEWSGRNGEPAWCADERVCRAAESVVVVFDEAGEPIQESIFASYSYRPAAAMLGRRGRGSSGDEEAVVAYFPSAASLD